MALTLDGSTALPSFGGSSSGLAGGLGAGAIGGGLLGLAAGALLGGGRGFGGWGNNGGAGTAVATDILLNPAFQSLQSQIQTVQQQIGANDLRNEMESVENTFATISAGQTAAISNGFGSLTQQLGTIGTAQAAGNFTTLQSINDLGRDVTTQSNQNALQQLNSFNNLTTTILQGFNGAAMQVQNATNQIISQGSANAATMAACCCDIKQLIQSDGNATRALINQLDKENLQAKLSAAQNEASNLNQTITAQNIAAAQTNIILQHLSPRSVVV